jgi:hypothetical protein
MARALGRSRSFRRDDEDDPSRVKVAFWGFSAVCYLQRDHPEFGRILGTLAAAVGSPAQVWFANRSWPLEGETEVWNAILDVRTAKL